METRSVIDLAVKAAEGVLIFRTNSFKPKTFIDIKSVRSSTASAIRALCKQHGYAGEIPLINVVEVVGNAVSSATEKWNKVSDPKNHVDRDWFRHCVCDLVAGAVTHVVFEERKRLDAEVYEEDDGEEECLDPARDDYEDFSTDTINTAIRKPVAAPYDIDDTYYGLEQDHASVQSKVVEHENTLLPNHQIGQGWAAIHHSEADHSTWETVNDPMPATSPSRKHNTGIRNIPQKRSALSTDGNDSGENEAQIIQPKRRRNANRPPAAPLADAVLGDKDDEDDDEKILANEVSRQQRKGSSKMLWTTTESDLLVTTRDSGKTWDEVHLSFSNRTKGAIMHKYRLLKDGKSSARNAVDGEDEGEASVQQAEKREGVDDMDPSAES